MFDYLLQLMAYEMDDRAMINYQLWLMASEKDDLVVIDDQMDGRGDYDDWLRLMVSVRDDAFDFVINFS